MNSVEDWLSSLAHPREIPPGTELSFDEWFLRRYEIETYLGAGTTAVAVLASDTVIDRKVVLKIWHYQYGVPPEVLLREARTLGRTKHPNIVEVYDYGDRPFPWVSLQYLGQTTLRTVLQERRHYRDAAEEAVEMSLQIAAALEYLQNSLGVFQIDLKPENLAFDRETRRLTLMDLGSIVEFSLYHPMRYGTPGYIAPEVFDKNVLTSACDIFSFGMLLYELLTGLRPFVEVQSEFALDNTRDCFDMPSSCAFVFPALEAAQEPRRKRKEQLQNIRDAMGAFQPDKDLSATTSPIALVRLVRAMLAPNPGDRPSADQVRLELETLRPGTSGGPRPSVFISHAHSDKRRFVDRFAKTLKEKGFDVWFDAWSLRAGEPFWERIGEAISKSEFVIVVLSQNSVSSRGVAEELRVAQLLNLGRKVKILPIRIDPIDFASIPIGLRSRHVLDFVGWQNNKKYNKMLAKLTADVNVLRDTERAC